MCVCFLIWLKVVLNGLYTLNEEKLLEKAVVCSISVCAVW